MKKTRINLLLTKEDYHRYGAFFQKLRLIILLFSFLLFSVTLIISILFYNQKQELDYLINKKNLALSQLNSVNQDFTKITALINRYNLLNKYLAEDANFLPYYSLLISSIPESTSSSRISKFTIDKQRNIEFIVSFDNFTDLMNFLKLIESKKFLENFELLSLKNFNFMTDNNSLSNKNYQLVFSGKFKKKYEKTF